MTRALRAIEADPPRLLEALRAALAADGPALHPIAIGAPPPAALPATVPQRIAVVVGTSGSTGRPKRVALSTSALLSSAAAAEAALGGPGQWLLALPAQWIAGLGVLVRSITMGTEPVVVGSGGLDPVAVAAAADRLDADRRYTSLVPVQLAALLEHEGGRAALQRLDGVLVGGQAAPAALLARARDAGVAVVTTYGASETAGGCVWDGRPVGDTAVAILDGRIHLAGAALADGYLDDPEREAEAFVEHDGRRWYRTDDAGVIEPATGRLVVTGRVDDVIVSGGAKLHLGELAATVAGVPGAGEVLAVALADDGAWGAVPAVLHTGALDAGEVRALAVAALGPAAGRLRLVRVDRIPVTATGKPDRAAAAAIARRR